MAQILLTLSYDGTQFAGFQVQKNARTVQATVQDAIEQIFGERYPVVGCSRTDAGVHARDYKLTFFTDSGILCDRIPAALNAKLPYDVSVLGASVVPDDFHVRHDVYEKEYEYAICNTPYRDPFSRHTAYHFRQSLDEQLLARAAAHFVGKHDFRAFMASGSDVADTVRTVRSTSVERRGDWVYIRIAADGFLYNMVRIFVGTLLSCAQGKYSADSIPAIISSLDRKNAGATAPACGLYLNRVTYLPQKGDTHDR
ncbi:MAG: tRNA pseudouridine(38-40) synthase TruA [Clostridia bacterium]|nr:tRNA pseudouridine(38-40) synthase TruA [Clostridia bacterium]